MTSLLIASVVFAALISFPLGIVMFWGGWKMLKLQSYGPAVTASIIALLPCQPFFFLGLVFGIWSLVVLNRPHIKAAFAEAARG